MAQFEDLPSDFVLMVLLHLNLNYRDFVSEQGIPHRFVEATSMLFERITEIKLFASHQDVYTYTEMLLKSNLHDDPYYRLAIGDWAQPNSLELVLPDSAHEQINRNGRSVLRRFIGRMFAHVTRLVIVGGVANEAHLVDLLQHFPQLKELTLFGITFQMTAHQR